MENARNVLKRKNMQRHFQNIFVIVSAQTLFLEILEFLQYFPLQPDIFFIAKGLSRFKNIYFYA